MKKTVETFQDGVKINTEEVDIPDKPSHLQRDLYQELDELKAKVENLEQFHA